MFIFFLLFVLFLSSNDLEISNKIVEDFETKNFSISDFQIHSNKQNDLKVSISNQIISPDAKNEKSLLIQIKSINSKIPMELIFKEPYLFEDYILSFEFLIYSNSSRGEIYFYFDDTKFQRHKILITDFKKEGWKKLKISLPDIISQKDYSHLKKTKTKFVGFLIQADLPNKKDLILAIDDISIEFKQRMISKF